MKKALCLLLLFGVVLSLAAVPFITLLDYEQTVEPLLPPYAVNAHGGEAWNLIPTIDGGFLAQLNLSVTYLYDSGYEVCIPYPMLFKLDAEGNIEWSRLGTEDIYHWGLVAGIVQTDDGGYLAIGNDNGEMVCDRLIKYNQEGFYLDEQFISLPDSVCGVDLLTICNTDSTILLGGESIDWGINYCTAVIDVTDGIDHPVFHMIRSGEYEDFMIREIIPTSDGYLMRVSFAFYTYGYIRVNRDFEFEWFREVNETSAMVQYSEGEYYLVERLSPVTCIFARLDTTGQTVESYNLDITPYLPAASLQTTADGNLLLFMGCYEGELHKITTDGSILWSRNNIALLPQLTDCPAVGQSKCLQGADGSIYYFCSPDEDYLHAPPLWVVGCLPDGTSDLDDNPQSGIQDELRVVAFPNPSRSGVSLSMSSQLSGEATLSLYNLRGQRILTKSLLLSVGTQTIELDSDVLNYSGSGVYFARIETRQGRTTTRFTYIK